MCQVHAKPRTAPHDIIRYLGQNRRTVPSGYPSTVSVSKFTGIQLKRVNKRRTIFSKIPHLYQFEDWFYTLEI
jgi:hypothetical protein